MVSAVFVHVGCDIQRGLPDIPHRVVNVDTDDEAMNAAIAKAKETFHHFEANWMRADVDGCGIKLAMKTDTDGVEHIWFTPLEIEGDQITASCANDPESIPGLRFGDVRVVDRGNISDWMIMEREKCYGGYTIRVLAEQDPASVPPFQFADYSP